MPYLEGIPLPDVKDWNTREWWEHCRQHRLVVQRCRACGTFRHPPSPICYLCRSFDHEWAPVSGKGVVYTYTIPHHPSHPAVRERVPYNVVVVELADAGRVRMVGNLLDCKPDEIAIGMAVEVVFQDVNESVTLPQWRKAR